MPNNSGLKPRKSDITRLDLWLATLVLSVSIVAIVWMSNESTDRTPSDAAYIYRGEQLVETVSLKADQHITLAQDGMQLAVRQGRIRVVYSDCKKQICVRRGWIRHGGDTIICVPNGIRIEIESKEARNLDAVVS